MSRLPVVYILAAFLGFCSVGSVQAILLTDDDSTVVFNENGITNWEVKGTDHLQFEWFWFRCGDDQERLLDSNFLVSLTQTSPGEARVVYFCPRNQIEFTVDLFLDGNHQGTPTSRLDEEITIRNLGQGPVQVDFFEYTNFDLNDTPNDRAKFASIGGPIYRIQQWDNLTLANVWTSTNISGWEIDKNDNIFDKLTDGDQDNLSDLTTPFGPTDVEFAYQWTFTVTPANSGKIQKFKTLEPIPEASTVVLMGLGVVGVGLLGRFRKRQAG